MAFQAYFRRRQEEAAAAKSSLPSSPTFALNEHPPSHGLVEVTEFNDGATPDVRRRHEYRRSYTNEGTLPARVLHLKSSSATANAVATPTSGTDGIDDDTMSRISEDDDVEKGVDYAPGTALPTGKELGFDEKEFEAGEKSSDESPIPTVNPNIVDWDSPDDPANPQNWTNKKKWGCISIVSAVTFLTPLASTMFAPGVPELMSDFHQSNTELAGFVVSVYIVGYLFGPIIIAPLSEIYGRRLIFNITNVLFLIFIVACALSRNVGEFIVFRFLSGFMGITPLTIGGGLIADIMPQERRGSAMAIWSCGPILGPIVGPIAGGFAASTIGWRWIFWIIAMTSGVFSALTFLLLKETYAPQLLKLKTIRLRKETGNESLRSRFDTGQTRTQIFKKAITRPMKLLVRSPIVFLLSLYMSICYGYIYLLFTTFTYVFEDQYGFSASTSGLAYLGIGIGSVVGLALTGYASDRIVKRMSAKGVMKPEYRLPPLIPASIFMPVGLFIYGWTAEKHVHWIVPILGTGIFGVGMLASFMPVSTYLIDAWPLYAASSTAAAVIMRSLFGALLPLAGQTMYAKLGLGWGNSVLAFISVAMLPVPWVFLLYGERIRTRFVLDL